MNIPSNDKLINIERAFNSAKYLDVLKQAEDLIKTYPSHKSGWNALGAVLMKMGEKQKALNIYINAVKLIPEDFDTYNNLGKVQQQLGHFNDSENSFLNRISTCFLTAISVQYGGDRFTAHTPTANHQGAEGSPPTKTVLTMEFQELETITRERVVEGY